MRAIGYVDAYDDATSFVPALLISVPRAGVDVMPPVMAPIESRRESLMIFFPIIYPIIIGITVMNTPKIKYILHAVSVYQKSGGF